MAAVLLAAALVGYIKICHAVARIWHGTVEALIIVALTAGTAGAVIVVTWATARILWHRRTPRQVMLPPVPSGSQQLVNHADTKIGCLVCGLDCVTCGDTGTVLEAITGGRYEERSCPVCQPVHRVR